MSILDKLLSFFLSYGQHFSFNIPLIMIKELFIAISALLLTTIDIATAAQTTTPPVKLNNTAFVGDSITHGVRTASYRFDFWKILADNKIQHKFIGVNKGNAAGFNKAFSYQGTPFNNIHSAGSSWRTYQTSGDYMQGNTQNGIGPASMPCGGYIANWLGLQDATTYKNVPSGKLKKGEYLKDNTLTSFNYTTYPAMNGANTPDTVLIMLGTNDLYSDKGGRYTYDQVLGFLKNIITFCRQANQKTNFVLISMPSIDQKKNAKGNTITQEYNDAILKSLSSLQKSTSRVIFANINKGITQSDGFLAPVMSLDGVHPSEQGNLIIAGNLAKAMNIGQRTAGLSRYTSSALPIKVKASTSGNIANSWNAGKQFTLATTFSMTNAGAKTTTPKPLIIQAGNGIENDATLTIHPDRITWGNNEQNILYLDDLTKSPHTVTLSLLDKSNKVDSGYYIWLDGQLIAEAKTSPVTEKNKNFRITATQKQLKYAQANSQQAYAPKK
ncbi:MAG: GDSL-type esterase/lipase family protein [Akkermansia sp.]